MIINKVYSCCFFGHRKISKKEGIKTYLIKIVEELIKTKNVNTFLFGSRSQFDNLCYEVVSELKEKYCNIKRIYVRAEYPHIEDNYRNYLLQSYEDTYYPENIINAGKAVYVERNYEMIDKCDYCIVYMDNNYIAAEPKSGTKYAYDYALKKGLKIVICNEGSVITDIL